VVAYGYDSDTIDKVLPPCQPNIKIKINSKQKEKWEKEHNKHQMKSVGGHIDGAAQPHANLDNPRNYLAGAMSRVCVEKYRPSRKLLRAICGVSTDWCTQFPQVPPDYDMSVEKWLLESKYPQWRKDQILAAWKGVDDENYVGSFLKDEQYKKYTHARTINARRDFYKALFGPIIHALEKCVFSHPSFVKRVEVHKRFQHLKSMLDECGTTVQWTDHTCYESVFTPDFVEASVMPLYAWCLAKHPCRDKFMSDYRKFVIGREGHTLKSKFMTIENVLTECSGEMDTSLKNGAANKLGADLSDTVTRALEVDEWAFGVSTVLSLLVRSLDDIADVISSVSVPHSAAPTVFGCGSPETMAPLQGAVHAVVCEGDDGVRRGKAETRGGVYAALGFDVKMVAGPDLEAGDFCSIDGSLASEAQVTDPMAVLCKFAWISGPHIHLNRRKCHELLKAKAMSLLASHPKCPILTRFAMYILRVLKDVDIRGFLRRTYIGRWERDKLLHAVENWKTISLAVQAPSSDARRVVESRYGILAHHQVDLENYFDSLTELCPLRHHLLRVYAPTVCVDYYARYVREDSSPPSVYTRYDNYPPGLRQRLRKSGLELPIDAPL